MGIYDPAIYDVFHDPDGADVRLYAEQARKSGGPVLELGAGTGRTLLPIARDGIEIHGLELDDHMIDALRDKLKNEPAPVRDRVQLFLADMRSFDLPQRYAAIHIPFRAFLHNIDAAAQLDCLRCCFAHLEPGGQLTFNIFFPSLSVMSQSQGALAGVWRWRDERMLPSGKRVIRSEATKLNTVSQTVSARLRYEVFAPDGHLESTHIQPLELAYLYPADTRERLTAAGFTNIHITANFTTAPIQTDTDEQIVQAQRT